MTKKHECNLTLQRYCDKYNQSYGSMSLKLRANDMCLKFMVEGKVTTIRCDKTDGRWMLPDYPVINLKTMEVNK